MDQNVFQNTLRGIIIYDATYVVGFVLMLLMSVFRCKIYNSTRARAVIYSFYTFFSGLAGALLIGVIYNWLFSLKGIETDVRVDMLGAVIFTLVFLLASVYTEKAILKKKNAAAANRHTPHRFPGINKIRRKRNECYYPHTALRRFFSCGLRTAADA